MQNWCRKKQRGPRAAAWLLLEPLGAAGMGTSAAAALPIHPWSVLGASAQPHQTQHSCDSCCWLPLSAHQMLPAPKYPGRAKTKPYPCSSDETLFANLCIYRFSGFADSGHLAAGKATDSHAGEHLSSPLPQPTTFVAEGCKPLSRTPALILTIATQLFLARHANGV